MVKQSINKEKSSVKPALRKTAKTVKATHAKKVISKKFGKENMRPRSSAMTAQQVAKYSKQKNGPFQVADLKASHNIMNS